MAAAWAIYARGLGQPGVADGGDSRGPRSPPTGAGLGVARTQARSGRAAAAWEWGHVHPRVGVGALAAGQAGPKGAGPLPRLGQRRE